MYGDIATKLIQELKRSLSLDTLPMHRDDLIQLITREVGDLSRESDILSNDIEDDRVKNCQLFITHLSMRRNKRCLLAYQYQRLRKLDELAWSNQELSKKQLANLSYNEQEYYRKYKEIMSEFKGEYTDIDLDGSMDPPRDIFIDVRVLKDIGEIQTEYGVFNMTKNSQFFVRQADVERLIQQGYLEKV